MTEVRAHLWLALLSALVPGLLPAAAAGQSPAPRGARVVAVPQAVRAEAGFDASHSAGLFVGIRHFDDRDFAEVPYAVDDAVDLAHLFALELRLIAPRRVVLSLAGEPQKPASRDRLRALRDAGAAVRPATHAEILALLARLARESRPQGLLVVALATHGFSDEGNDFLLASDSLRHRLRSTGVAVARVFESLSQARAPRRLLLLDACREKLSPSRALSDKHGAMSPALADAIAGASGQVVLSSTTLGGFSYDDPDRGNGVFTGAVLDGLRGQAPGDERSFITVRLLADFVDRQVARWIRRYRPEHAEVSRGISVRLEAVAVAEMPLAVASAEPAAPEVPRPPGDRAPDEVDLTGEWKGIFHSYPYVSGMDVTVHRSYDNSRHRFEGRAHVYPLEIPRRYSAAAWTGTFEVTIEYDPHSRSLVIRPGDWLGSKPSKGRAAVMTAVYSRADDTVAGLLAPWDSSSTPFFALQRPAHAARLVEPALAALHATQRSPWVRWARGGPSKERLDEWADRYLAEYPGTPPNQIVMGRLWADARKLFKDSHFKEYFGRPYDQLAKPERMDAWKKLRQRGPQEESPRNRFADGPFVAMTGTFGMVDLTVSVLAMRSIDSCTPRCATGSSTWSWKRIRTPRASSARSRPRSGGCSRRSGPARSRRSRAGPGRSGPRSTRAPEDGDPGTLAGRSPADRPGGWTGAADSPRLAGKGDPMSQAQSFADQLERAFRGGAWHGPAVSEALAGVDAAAAAARPVPGGHTIWETVHHLTTWNEVPRRRLDGERLENLPESSDWPPVRDASAAAWQAALDALEEAHRALHARVLDLADDQLDAPVAGSDPTVRGMLLGVLQHNAYHAGQIVLLRRALEGAQGRP